MLSVGGCKGGASKIWKGPINSKIQRIDADSGRPISTQQLHEWCD